MNFIAVKTGATWMKFEKIVGPVGCGQKNNEKIFPFLMLRDGPTGTRTKSMFSYNSEKSFK
jgi:hypothetical protein